jgi:hypothetical protein
MLLGPRWFADAPALPTFILPGDPQHGGRLFFSADDRHLFVVGIGSRLQVWDLAARRRVIPPPDLWAWDGVLDGERGGLLVVEDGEELQVVGASMDGSDMRTLVRGLPRRQPDDGVSLWVLGDTALVASSRWARWCDLRAGRVTGGFDYRAATGQEEVAHARPVCWQGALHLRLVWGSYRNERGDYTNGVWAADGAELARLTWRLPGLDRVAWEGDGLLAVAADSSGAVAVLDGGPDLFRVRPLEGFAPGMWFGLSQGGRVVVGCAPERLAVWRDGELLRAFDCDGAGYGAWPSDDGRLATLVYEPGHLGIAAGVLDLTTGRVLGRCDWHVALFCWAYSNSNRYVASLMTDSHYNYQAGLESGTIVVTELPPLG